MMYAVGAVCLVAGLLGTFLIRQEFGIVSTVELDITAPLTYTALYQVMMERIVLFLQLFSILSIIGLAILAFAVLRHYFFLKKCPCCGRLIKKGIKVCPKCTCYVDFFHKK